VNYVIYHGYFVVLFCKYFLLNKRIDSSENSRYEWKIANPECEAQARINGTAEGL